MRWKVHLWYEQETVNVEYKKLRFTERTSKITVKYFRFCLLF